MRRNTQLFGLAGVGFAYFVQLANGMMTAPTPLTYRDCAVALAPALLCSVLWLVQIGLARQLGNWKQTLAWNSVPLVCTALSIVIVLAGSGTRVPTTRRAERVH